MDDVVAAAASGLDGIEWTSVLIALIAYGAGVLQEWLRLHRDAKLGRSLRPPPPRKPPK